MLGSFIVDVVAEQRRGAKTGRERTQAPEWVRVLGCGTGPERYGTSRRSGAVVSTAHRCGIVACYLCGPRLRMKAIEALREGGDGNAGRWVMVRLTSGQWRDGKLVGDPITTREQLVSWLERVGSFAGWSCDEGPWRAAWLVTEVVPQHGDVGCGRSAIPCACTEDEQTHPVVGSAGHPLYELGGGSVAAAPRCSAPTHPAAFGQARNLPRGTDGSCALCGGAGRVFGAHIHVHIVAQEREELGGVWTGRSWPDAQSALWHRARSEGWGGWPEPTPVEVVPLRDRTDAVEHLGGTAGDVLTREQEEALPVLERVGRSASSRALRWPVTASALARGVRSRGVQRATELDAVVWDEGYRPCVGFWSALERFGLGHGDYEAVRKGASGAGAYLGKVLSYAGKLVKKYPAWTRWCGEDADAASLAWALLQGLYLRGTPSVRTYGAARGLQVVGSYPLVAWGTPEQVASRAGVEVSVDLPAPEALRQRAVAMEALREFEGLDGDGKPLPGARLRRWSARRGATLGRRLYGVSGLLVHGPVPSGIQGLTSIQELEFPNGGQTIPGGDEFGSLSTTIRRRSGSGRREQTPFDWLQSVVAAGHPERSGYAAASVGRCAVVWVACVGDWVAYWGAVALGVGSDLAAVVDGYIGQAERVSVDEGRFRRDWGRPPARTEGYRVHHGETRVATPVLTYEALATGEPVGEL